MKRLLILTTAILTLMDGFSQEEAPSAIDNLILDITQSIAIRPEKISIQPLNQSPLYTRDSINAIVKDFDTYSKNKFTNLFSQTRIKHHRVTVVPKSAPKEIPANQVTFAYSEIIGYQFINIKSIVENQSKIPILEKAQYVFAKKGWMQDKSKWSAYYVPHSKCRLAIKKLMNNPKLYESEELHMLCPDIVEIGGQ